MEFITSPIAVIHGMFNKSRLVRQDAFKGAFRLMKGTLWISIPTSIFFYDFNSSNKEMNWFEFLIFLIALIIFFFPSRLEPLIFKFLSIFYSYEEMTNGVNSMKLENGGEDKSIARKYKILENIKPQT
jgi:hypothetical protein